MYFKYRKTLISIGIVTILFLSFNSLPHYMWASFRGGVPAYKAFVERFPQSDLADPMREKIRRYQEGDIWEAAQKSKNIVLLRNYCRIYPKGRYFTEANTMIPDLADKQWTKLSNSKSEEDIRAFLRRYPETTKAKEVEMRIQELLNDWNWVREQDTIKHYQLFANRFPNHQDNDWLQRRIIDLEVRDIATGEHGEMPRAQQLSFGGSIAKVEVENKTGYVLTVRYSGPDSKKIVIPKGVTSNVSLAPGNYKVAASVNASNVTNYYGTDTMKGGKYSSSFYIQTDIQGFSLPSYNR